MINLNIKQMRVERGITQEALAMEMGVSQSAVAKWETDKALPQASLLPALAAALNCTINDLFAVEQ